MTVPAQFVRNLLFSVMLALPLAAVAAPMTNDDVIKMVKGGLGEATVIQAIDGAEPGFDTSPDGLVKLKQGGVSDNVIQRILAKKGAAACKECGTVTGIGRFFREKGAAVKIIAVQPSEGHDVPGLRNVSQLEATKESGETT